MTLLLGEFGLCSGIRPDDLQKNAKLLEQTISMPPLLREAELCSREEEGT